MSETALLPPERRLKDLRAAQIANLPSPRQRRRYRVWAATCPLMALGFAYRAATERPLFVIPAVMFLAATYGCLRAARQVTAQLRAPAATPYAAFDEGGAFGEFATTTAEGAVGAVASGTGGVLEAAAGYASKWTDRLWGLRKPGMIARWQAAIAPDLRDGEQVVVSSQARLVPRGPVRVLLFMTCLIAWPLLVKRGFLTVTDQRLLFHRWSALRRKHRVLHLSAPLEEVEVLDWFEGSHSEARSRVLVTRGPEGRVARFNIDRVWAEEAQWVFDVVASHTERPPAFLAARWSYALA